MKHLLSKFFKEEEGSIVEYLLLIAVAGIIAAFLFPGLKGNIAKWFNDMVTNVSTGITKSGTCSGGTGAAGGSLTCTN